MGTAETSGERLSGGAEERRRGEAEERLSDAVLVGSLATSRNITIGCYS